MLGSSPGAVTQSFFQLKSTTGLKDFFLNFFLYPATKRHEQFFIKALLLFSKMPGSISKRLQVPEHSKEFETLDSLVETVLDHLATMNPIRVPQRRNKDSYEDCLRELDFFQNVSATRDRVLNSLAISQPITSGLTRKYVINKDDLDLDPKGVEVSLIEALGYEVAVLVMMKALMPEGRALPKNLFRCYKREFLLKVIRSDMSHFVRSPGNRDMERQFKYCIYSPIIQANMELLNRVNAHESVRRSNEIFSSCSSLTCTSRELKNWGFSPLFFSGMGTHTRMLCPMDRERFYVGGCRIPCPREMMECDSLVAIKYRCNEIRCNRLCKGPTRLQNPMLCPTHIGKEVTLSKRASRQPKCMISLRRYYNTLPDGRVSSIEYRSNLDAFGECGGDCRPFPKYKRLMICEFHTRELMGALKLLGNLMFDHGVGRDSLLSMIEQSYPPVVENKET